MVQTVTLDKISKKTNQLQKPIKKIDGLLNNPIKIDGLKLMKKIEDDYISTVFFDPQYRGILDKQNYGNEGKNREKRRVNLSQMSEDTIIGFLKEIDRVLKPSGHLFLWVDKFHLCEGTKDWISGLNLQVVDLIVWEKPRIGMGYRTRNKSEFLLVLQKKPIRAKGCWTIHNIPNVWQEGVKTDKHPHTKPTQLQARLIEATTKVGDVVLDPAMGGGSVFESCKIIGRDFIGGDIKN